MSARASLLAVAILFALVLASAFGVVSSTHHSRDLYTLLQQHEGQRWYLEEEYSRLLLEQSTWASHHRIAIEAGDSLGLSAPDLPRTRLVTP